MQQALPCPPVFRPSARVRWSNCRPLCLPSPGPWLLARRLGEARRPGSGVGVVLDLGPLCSAAFVRASFSARRGVHSVTGSARCDRCERASRGTCGVRLGGGAGSLRSVRPVRAGFSEREVFDSVRGNGSLHSRSRSAAFKRASFSEREMFDSVPANGSFSLGGGPGGRSARRRSSSRLASAELLPGSNCRSQTTVSLRRCSSSRRSPGTTPFGGCGASIWRSAWTRAPVQRLGGARPQPQRRISPSRRQPDRGRARCGPGSSTSSRSAASGRSSSTASPQCPFFVASSST